MKIQFLGTSAAEGIPALFCHCSICNQARKEKNRNVRTRSQALIDDFLLIDFGPDTFFHALKYDINLADINHCLITHVHDDHFYISDLKARRRSRANLKPGTPPLNVYGSLDVQNELKPDCDGFVTKDRSVLYHKLLPFSELKIDDYTVIALPAVHNTSNPFVYVIKKEKTMLYAHDTDIFEDKTWKFLQSKKIKFDFLSLDCTEGKKNIDYPGHMNFERMTRFCKIMKKLFLIDEETLVFANHFSHNGLVNYQEACEIGNSLGFSITYDGLVVNF